MGGFPTNVTHYKGVKKLKVLRKGKKDPLLTVNGGKAKAKMTSKLQAQGERMEKAAAAKRAKAKRDADRISFLLANPKT